MSFYYTWKNDRELGLDDVYVQRGDVLAGGVVVSCLKPGQCNDCAIDRMK